LALEEVDFAESERVARADRLSTVGVALLVIGFTVQFVGIFV
jgi:hypothetical protein